MELINFAKQINIDIEEISQEGMEFGTYLYEKYKNDLEMMKNIISECYNKEEIQLVISLLMGIDTKKKYEEQKISKEIFLDSISDIKIWQEDYYYNTGKMGLKEFDWILKTLEMKLFKLGSLQFEKIKLDYDIKADDINIKSGDYILDTHIQKGADLSREKLNNSYKMAEKFFGVNKFICTSWLLSPDLDKIINYKSKILDFKSDYKIIKEEKPHPQMEERVFGYLSNNKNIYKENTKLQKNLKKYLIEGNSVGIAVGVYER